MIVKPIVYNARACENDVSCFTLSFLRSFRHKTVGRLSAKRKTSVAATPDVRHFYNLRPYHCRDNSDVTVLNRR